MPESMAREVARAGIISEALKRARLEIGTMPFDQAMRIDDSGLMRVAVRHALDIVKEKADAQVV